MKYTNRAVMLLVLGFGLALGTGCSCTPDGSIAKQGDVTKWNTYWNLTPELDTTADTYDQHHFNLFRTQNYHARMIKDDWNRTWLVDKPVRLSSYPIP
jgi:hypothetical protein